MLTEILPRKVVKNSLCGVGLLLAAGAALAADPLSTAVDATVEADKEAAASQQRIDRLADQTQSLLQEYRQASAQADDLNAYNDQLERLVANQKTEVESLARQLAGVRETDEKIVPLMRKMVQVLEEFVNLDMPFLLAERKTRVEALKAMLDQPDVSLPEKYRRIMEAYQIEAEYGRTIEAYSEPMKQDGQTRTVDVLRVGRVALLYVTFDRNASGYWDKATRTWKTLPSEFNHSIGRGLQIARKEAPPELVTLPIPAPEAVR